MVNREVLTLEHTVLRALPLRDLNEIRLDAVFAALLGHQCEREFRADDRDVGPKLEQERDGADMVLVRMSNHQRLHLLEAVLDVAQVWQDQVDAGFVVAGEEHPAVDDQQPAQMLENGHVAADFADSTQRSDPQSAWGHRPRWLEVFVHYLSTVSARMSAASASSCSEVAGTCGSRGSPPSMPCNRSPALASVTPPRRAWAAFNGPSVTLILRAVATSPEVNADHMSRS